MEKLIITLVPLYILYIIALGILMFKQRTRAIKDKKINLNYFKDYQGSSPYDLMIYKNHFENQFQLPIIFMIACTSIAIKESSSLLTVFLCYFFFATRILHSYFHLGPNDLKARGLSYFAGAISLLGIWIEFSYQFFK